MKLSKSTNPFQMTMNQVLCKQSDVDKVNSVLPMAVKDYSEFMKNEAGMVMNMKVRCSTKHLPPTAQPLMIPSSNLYYPLLGYGEHNAIEMPPQ